MALFTFPFIRREVKMSDNRKKQIWKRRWFWICLILVLWILSGFFSGDKMGKQSIVSSAEKTTKPEQVGKTKKPIQERELIGKKRFEDIGYYKKKLQNGSYTRVFSVYVKDFKDVPETWNSIQNYAKGKMYTAGGSTTVFFFNNRNGTPDVTFVAEQFNKKYEQYCVAAYWKYPRGNDKFIRYPFRQ